MATNSNISACRIPWTEEPGGLQSMRQQTVRHNWSNLACTPMQETRVQSLGWEDLLEEEMTIHSSILAWKILWTEETDRLKSVESQRARHNKVTEHVCTHTNQNSAVLTKAVTQINRKEQSSGISHDYNQLIYDKGGKNIKWWKSL